MAALRAADVEPPVGSEAVLGRRPRPRIETLADLIFGLSLAVDSIALIPTGISSAGDMNVRILSFAFAFLFLITAWLIYTTYMSVLPVDTMAVTFLNVALLLLVSLIPFLLNSVVIQFSGVQDYAAVLFGLDLTGILVILAILAHVISREDRKLVAPEIAKLFRSGRNRMSILAVLMAVSIAPIFGEVTFLNVQARIYLWAVPLISYWVGRALSPESRTYKLS